MKIIRPLLIALMLAALVTTPSLAGVVYEIETTDHEQSPPKTESIEMAAEGRHLKMGIPSNSESGTKDGFAVFKGGDDPKMVIVDNERQSYYVMDRTQAQAIAGQVNSAMSQMQEALKNIPEDKRAMVEQMMKQRMPQQEQAPEQPKSTLRKTGEKATHSGFPCVKYEVLNDGRKVRELWVTDWKNIEGSDGVADTFEEMASFFRELMDSVSSLAGAAGGGLPGGTNLDFFEHMKDLGGFPVVTREFGDDGSLEGESTLRSARRQTIDPDAFEPPSGYKRQEMFSGQ